jgi:hypothetical protein
MTTYLVETYLSSVASLDDVEGHASRAAASVSTDGARVRLDRCIYIAEDETCFLLFDAGSIDAVRMATERAGIVPQRVVETVDYRPDASSA